MEYTIPTYTLDTNEWSETNFYSKEEFTEFIGERIKYPGSYEFSIELVQKITERAIYFNKHGYYDRHVERSKDYYSFWRPEKQKCTKGVIWKDGDKVYYTTREYYMWLNFLPIFVKKKNAYDFPSFRDGQYHIALIELHAELLGLHIVMTKRRQYAMSYYHCAKIINQIWFENGITIKFLAFLDQYIEAAWPFLDEYKNFLNEHSSFWYRAFTPEKVGNWQQKYETTTPDGRKVTKGNKSRVIAKTTKDSPTKAVSGASKFFFYEEAGISGNLKATFGYAKSAMMEGFEATGQFIAFGSVGDLKQCEDLKYLMYNAKENGFYSIKEKYFSEKGNEKEVGFFVPTFWNFAPFEDEAGNSDIERAIAALKSYRAKIKEEKSPEDYQLEVSQNPIYLEEAFAMRHEPYFPKHLVEAQIYTIEEENKHPYQVVDIELGADGNYIISKSDKQPYTKYPVDKKDKNKEGAIIMYERPDKSLPWLTYYGSIDPVAGDGTTSSNSLVSIFIWKNEVEVTRTNSEGDVETFVEPGKLVCEWTGRFDDGNKNHERCLAIVEAYNAWTIYEANISGFHTYMTLKKKLKYLVPSNQIIFNKQAGDFNPKHPYGWKNTGTIFMQHMMPYFMDFIKEELEDEEVDGKLKRVYGISRVISLRALKEMKEFTPGINADQIIALVALIAFVQIQAVNRRVIKKDVRETQNSNLDNSRKITKFLREPFSNMPSTTNSLSKVRRSPFHSLR